MRKTEWYPGTVKPVRVGWYEVERAKGYRNDCDFWDGQQWCWGVEGKFMVPYLPSEQERLPWRGLTEEIPE